MRCKNCGADQGLHHHETMQCPVGGREAPIGRKQEWMATTYQEDDSEERAELRKLVGSLEDTLLLVDRLKELEKRFAILEGEVAELRAKENERENIEIWNPPGDDLA